MYYRETMNRINEHLKESKVIWNFIALDSFGTLNLLKEIVTCNSSCIPSMFFSVVLGCMVVIYKIENKILKIEKYKEEHINEYEELKKLYNEYIEIVAKIVSKYKFEDSLQFAMAIDTVLLSGCFSINNEYTFKRHREINEYFEDLIGTYVIEGNGVCRHNTAFISDVLNKMGLKNFKLYTTREKNSDKANHVLLALVHNNQSFAYDFTNHTIGVINEDKTISLRGLKNEEIFKHYIVSKHNEEEIEELYKLERLNLTFDLLVQSLSTGVIGGILMSEELFGLYENNKDLMNEIAQKSLTLMPRR